MIGTTTTRVCRGRSIAGAAWIAAAITVVVVAGGPAPAPTAAPAGNPAGQNVLALELFRAVLPADGRESCVVAPAGVAAVLGMALEGARGATAAEIARVLRIDGPGASFEGLYPMAGPDAGAVRPVEKPTLGADLASNEGYGVKVIDVPAGSAAERAGLKPGDLVLAVNGRPVRSRPRLDAALPTPPGPVRLQVFEYESGRVVELQATPDLAAPPEQGEALGQPGSPRVPAALRITRAAWVQSGTASEPSFQAAIRKRFGAELTTLNFRDDPPAARRAIAAWFASGTSGPADRAQFLCEDLGPDTRLLLADRLEMHGTWPSPFPAAAPGPFRTESGKSANRPLMRLTGRFRIARLDRFAALELPYAEGGGSLAMLIVLPVEGEPLGRFASALTAADLAGAYSALRHQAVELVLPKFRISQAHRLERVLSTLGMPRAFGDRAEFPAIDPRHPLRLSAVRQTATIEVDEQGTRAETSTSATGVLIKGDEATPVPFHADRPFLFAVIDARGSIVLIGCVR